MLTCVWTTSFFFVSSLKRTGVFGSWRSSGEGLQSHIVLSRSFFYSHCWPYPSSIFWWFSARMHSSRAPSLWTWRLSASILQDVPILLHDILLFLLSFWSFYTSKKLVGFYLANLTMTLIVEIFWKCAQVKTAPMNTAGAKEGPGEYGLKPHNFSTLEKESFVEWW